MQVAHSNSGVQQNQNLPQGNETLNDRAGMSFNNTNPAQQNSNQNLNGAQASPPQNLSYRMQDQPQYQGGYDQFAPVNQQEFMDYHSSSQPQIGSTQQPTEECFFLMDCVGGGCSAQSGNEIASRSQAVLHPTKPVVAYSAGCMIIVFDLMSDQKVHLPGHQHDIHALAFTPNGENLLSVDFNRNAELQDNMKAQGATVQEPTSKLLMWDWQKGQLLLETDIPRSQTLSMVLPPQHNQDVQSLIGDQSQDQSNIDTQNQVGCRIQIIFEKSGTLFSILESSPLEIGGGYRVTVWSLSNQNVVEMISSMDLEMQCPALGFKFMPRAQSDVLNAQRSAGQSSHAAQVYLNSKIPFLTVEKQCIKMWEYSQGNAQLKRRIHIKQPIVSLEISDLTGFFIILGESGKVLILDQQGEFVSTVSKEGIFITNIGAAYDKMMLGTNRGTVLVYHMASLQFISEIPFQLSFLEKFSLNSFTKSIKEVETLSLQKVGPPVQQLGTTQSLRFLWIRYSDGSFAVIDRTIMNPRQAILGYSCGHFESVSGLQWIQPKSALDIDSKHGASQSLMNAQDPNRGFNGPVATHTQQFVTCAHDLSIHVWRHYGDRWACSYIDVAKSFDQALTFQRKQCDKSTRDLKLTALCLYPRSNNLIVGDNRGFVRIFQLVNENAHLIATYRLPRSQEVKAERALGISQNSMASRIGVEDLFTNDLIKDIYITHNEQTAVITFSSGMISLYDVKNGYTWVGDIMNQDYQKFNTQSQGSGALQTKVIEVSQQAKMSMSLSSFRDGKSTIQQDEQPFGYGSYSDLGAKQSRKSQSGYFGSHSSNLKVLSLQTPNQVQMQLVDVKGTKLTRSPLCHYVISEGKVTGFDLHPSEDYLLITSSMGRIYVFRIDTGELRGTIRIPLNSSGCQSDPSGLYVITKVPAFAALNAINLTAGGGSGQAELGHFGANEKDLSRNTVIMYEIGTGLPAAEVPSIFEVSQMKFSPDGRYLSLGSTSGAISVFSMANHLHQNVKQVIDAMKLQDDFWFNYPIFLPDYEQFNQPENDIISAVSADDANRGYQQLNLPNQIREPQNFSSGGFQAQQVPTYSPQQLGGEMQNINYDNQADAQSQGFYQQQEQFQNYQMQPNNQAIQMNYQSERPPSYRPVQQPMNPMMGKSITPVVNEQRFLRNSFVEPQRIQQSPQQRPVQQRQQQLQDQYANQQRELLLSEQRRQNDGLYAPQQSMLPPDYGQIYSQQQQQLPEPQFNPQQQPSPKRQYPNQNQPYLYQQQVQMPNQNRMQNFQQQQQQIQNQHQPQMQNQWTPQQFNQQRPMSYPMPNMSARSGNYQQVPMYNQNTQQPQFYNQNTATETLLGASPPRQRLNQGYPQGQVDLNEPAPFNHSQLLYNQPINATVQGPQTLEKGQKFERYVDIPNQTMTPQLKGPNTESAQRTAFDGTLNDRAPMVNTLSQSGYQQQSFVRTLPAQLDNTTKTIEEEMNKLAQKQASPGKQVQQVPVKKEVEAENKQDFVPRPFSGTLAKQDVVQQRVGMQPDPSDIDAGLTQTQDSKKLNGMIQELDGKAKYLDGVTIPKSLKEQKAPGQNTNNLNQQFDQRKADIPPPASSGVKSSSNYEVVDELYASMNDFDKKLETINRL